MKKNLKIIYALFLFILSFSHLFAFSEVDLKVSKNEVLRSEAFEVHIIVTTDESGKIDFKKLNWLEDFDLISQSKSSSFSNLNWKTMTKISYIYNLKSRVAWEYFLWPSDIFINDDIYISNVENIKVIESNVWTKIYDQEDDILEENNTKNEDIKDDPASEKIDPNKEDTKEQKPKVEKDLTQTNDQKEETTKKDEVSINSDLDKNSKDLNTLDNKEKMIEDLNPVKEPLSYFYLNYIFIWFLVALFLTIFYVFLLKYLRSKKEVKNIKKSNSKTKKLDENYVKNELYILKEEYSKISKSEFYEKINSLFRIYFEEKWFFWAKNMTEKELKKSKKMKWFDDFFDLFKYSYYLEFSNDSENDLDNRKKILKSFIKLLKEKK